MFDLPPGHPDEGQAIAAYYLWLFPNMMFNFYPWGLSVNIVIPVLTIPLWDGFISGVLNIDEYEKVIGLVLTVAILHRDDELALMDRFGFDTVEHQDQWVIEEVQKSMASMVYDLFQEILTNHADQSPCIISIG